MIAGDVDVEAVPLGDVVVLVWVAVAPVYFFVMPRLDNGFGLLALIFGYTFFFGCLGGRAAACGHLWSGQGLLARGRIGGWSLPQFGQL